MSYICASCYMTNADGTPTEPRRKISTAGHLVQVLALLLFGVFNFVRIPAMSSDPNVNMVGGLLLGLGLPIGLLIFGRTIKTVSCGKCNAAELVPLDTPRGQKLLGEARK